MNPQDLAQPLDDPTGSIPPSSPPRRGATTIIRREPEYQPLVEKTAPPKKKSAATTIADPVYTESAAPPGGVAVAPPREYTGQERAVAVQAATEAVAQLWQEPEFDEKTPAVQDIEDRLSPYDELVDHVFRRKDQPQSEKRYEVTGIRKAFDGKTQGRLYTCSNEPVLVAEVSVFVYEPFVDRNGRRKKRLLTQVDADNALTRPSIITVPCQTFKQLFEMVE